MSATPAAAGERELVEWTYVECADCVCPHDHGARGVMPETAEDGMMKIIPATVKCAQGCACEGVSVTMQIPAGSYGPVLTRNTRPDPILSRALREMRERDAAAVEVPA